MLRLSGMLKGTKYHHSVQSYGLWIYIANTKGMLETGHENDPVDYGLAAANERLFYDKY